MNVLQQKGAQLDSDVAWLLLEVERLGRVVDGATADLVLVPVGGVIFWPSGSIPAGWAEYTALAGRVPVGAGGIFSNGASGGTTYHSHGVSAIVVANDTHSHSDGSLSAANDTHNHPGSPLVLSASTANALADSTGIADLDVAQAGHTHNVSGNVGNDTHNHTVSGSTANDTHNHGLSGSTDNSTDVAFPWHCGRWIQRVA